jgi:hypothetical protein
MSHRHLRLLLLAWILLARFSDFGLAQRVSNFQTNFTSRVLTSAQNSNLIPNSSVMGTGAPWSRSQWNSADLTREGPLLPSWTYNYDYICANFDAYAQYRGAAANVLLSPYSDLVILGAGDDQVVVANDFVNPWLENDVVIGGAGDDKVYFLAECGGPNEFQFTYRQDSSGNESDGYNGICVEIVKKGRASVLRVYGVERFYFAATGVLLRLQDLRPPSRVPEVRASPQSQTIEEGGSLQLAATIDYESVAVSFPGTSGALWLNPQYQWKRNGLDLLEGGKVQGARTLSLRIFPISKADVGEYTIVATNQAGSVTSQPAMINVVGAAPEIVSPPQSRNVLLGAAVAFSVTASGRAPLSYQWYFDGNQPIPGRTGASLSIPSVSASDQGRYSVTVQNAVGVTTSAGALLQILEPPVITRQPLSVSIPRGGSASFSVEASGGPPLSYQWFDKNSLPISGASASSLQFSNVQLELQGSYSVKVVNEVGSSTSQPAFLSVIEPPQIRVDPAAVAVSSPGQSVALKCISAGVHSTSYQWYFNGMPLVGATEPLLSLPNLQTTGVGRYWVVASNAAGSVRSESIPVEIRRPEVVATHSIVAGGYRPSRILTVDNRFEYSGSASALSWAVLLPSGWTLESATAGGVALIPRAATGLVEWNWPELPGSPFAFSYTIKVPPSADGPAELVALVGLNLGDVIQFLARPDPLSVSPLLVHAADLDANFRIGLLELTRVIELYNTRHSSGRTGAYGVSAVDSEDGFSIDSVRSPSVSALLSRYHSADSNRDGKIGLLELTRVIELYNTRSGGSRTGQYKPQAGTEDGFAPGT